jgi:hypothetical protein
MQSKFRGMNMKITFKNNSSFETIKNKNDVVRGVRSNFITTLCYNTETDEILWVCLDMREPCGRYIPLYWTDID